jgi:hypothetical protein
VRPDGYLFGNCLLIEACLASDALRVLIGYSCCRCLFTIEACLASDAHRVVMVVFVVTVVPDAARLNVRALHLNGYLGCSRPFSTAYLAVDVMGAPIVTLVCGVSYRSLVDFRRVMRRWIRCGSGPLSAL